MRQILASECEAKDSEAKDSEAEDLVNTKEYQTLHTKIKYESSYHIQYRQHKHIHYII